MKTKVIYWFSIPSPDFVAKMNAAASLGEIDLEVWFNARNRKFRSWRVDESEWHFKYRFIPTIRIFGRDFGIPPLLSKRHSPDVLFMLYCEPVFVVGWLIAKLRGIKTVFPVERAADIYRRRRWWKEILKKWMLSGASAITYIGEDTRKYSLKYNVKGAPAYILPHVVDVDHFSKSLAVGEEERQASRERFGLKGLTFVYVGRFLRLKGMSVLLKAFSALQKEGGGGGEISLLLVGDGDFEREMAAFIKSEGIRNVAFAGFIQRKELPACYAAGDIFVFPTLGDAYGLAVDEAMAAGLPVISTSAAGEIAERIKDGVSGFIVGPDNPEALCARMKELAADEGLRNSMREAARSWIRDRTPRWWAEIFGGIVRELAGGGRPDSR